MPVKKPTKQVAKKTRAKKTRSRVLEGAYGVPKVEDTGKVDARKTVTPKGRWYCIEPMKIPQSAWNNLLDILRETGHITNSCALAGIKRVTLYAHRRADEKFEERFKEAHQEGLTLLEDHAVQRATQGVTRDVYYQGEVVGTLTEYSDTLLQFLLSANDNKYRRKQELTGADGQPLLYQKFDDKELDELIALRTKQLEERT